MKIRMVKCPQCGQLAEYSPNNPCRPFCSDRCKLIDLGEWAEGNYSIPDRVNSPEIATTKDSEDSE